jgi:two-component system, NtrC family, response regulator AtoC
MARLLVVDDDPDMCAELSRLFSRRGHQVVTSQAADLAFDLLKEAEDDFDLVVTDLNMRGMNGIELCDRVVQNWRDLPVIIVTAFGSMETAVATMRAGAFDFLTKPFHTEALMVAVERALRHRALTEEVKRLRRESARTSTFGMIGESAPMQRVFELVERVAETDVTVLVTGESGAGKELVARAIHGHGRRAQGPMVAINCAAMPENLLESELFGHAKGAFTDARTARKGLFVEAEGGTLFLDEVGEMPLAMQAKLLRALETRHVRPVGAATEVAFDARLVTATNRDLETRIAEKTFREDLYYRINVVHVEVPPLRSRGNDVLLLAQAFLERFAARHGKKVASYSKAVAEKLLAYAWPGNVRELSNTVERAVALARFEELQVEDLAPRVRDYRSSHVLVAADDPSELVTMEEVEARYIRRVLESVGGSKSDAARVLGFDRSTLYRKLERYRIVVDA